MEMINKKGKYLIKERISHMTMQRFDYFGGRSLLEGDIVEDSENEDNIEIKLYASSTSKFSIVIVT